MRKHERRFARFYYDDFLREYPEVYRDDAALAAWLRLLVASEKAWPTPPELPRSVRPSALRTLTAAELVALGPSHTFAVRGHDKERSRRHGIATTAADARWDAVAPANADADGDANAPALAVPRRESDETRRDSPPPQVGRRKDKTNQRALGTNPRANGTSPRQEREAQKRGPTKLHEILTSIQKGPVGA